MNLEFLVMSGIITILASLVVHYVTKGRMNEAFRAEVDKIRKEFVLVTVCNQERNSCQANQKERRDMFDAWLKKVEEKLDRVIEGR